ncbi:hypothetical protein [Pseudofulvibacter geojedonensis]|uniref:Uncharacterized protein n=1 Tax=Pseudofulvibacter geojedonensis TaxID=1123758 RepID=A0ABW3I426_9FLAO
MKNLFYILCFLSFFANAQENVLEKTFSNLINKTWFAEGNWGDGSKFKQQVTFSYSLDKTIILANAKGYTNKEQTKYGNRTHGIRKFNSETNTIEFWEFDVFGGLTKGNVFLENKNIVYQYLYGKSIVTDMWEYVNDNTYNFIVGNYVNGKWNQKYLETKFNLVR